MCRVVNYCLNHKIMDKKEFKEFFSPYAKNVDSSNQLAFWKLSDALIRKIINTEIAGPLTPGQVILDAGGGTGRWICDLSEDYLCDFLLYDLSEDMLAVAAENIRKKGIVERVRTVHGDLCDMRAVPDSSIDHVISIYSPLSFIAEKNRALKELHRVLKPGGRILVMGHSFYNALYSKINNSLASAAEIRRLYEESIVKWAAHVPDLWTFSQESMLRLLAEAGFSPLRTYGVPVIVQPGPEDFDPRNEMCSRISQKLAEDPEFYHAVFELEMSCNSRPEVVNRGMNIFALAEKR